MVSKKKLLKIEKLKRKARDLSIKESIYAWGRDSFGDKFVAPFAIAINSTNSMVALLSAVTGLLGPLFQLFGSRLPEQYPRKKIILKTVFYESLMWLPFIAIAILFYFNIIPEMLPYLLLFSFSLVTIFLHLGHPAWFSWMGDIINEKDRGRWFAKRSLIGGFVSIILTILASVFLDYFKTKGWIMFGFMTLFFLAFIARYSCYKIYKIQYEPKIKLKEGYYFSFWSFVINAPQTNFGKFTIFRTFFSFANSISASLLAIYLLRNLQFSYTIYMAITLSLTLFSLFVLGLWGKFADLYGNYRVLCITTIFIPTIPILYILSPSPIYLILIPSLIGGISWAGFDLVARNFVYDNVRRENRGLIVSYYNLLIGIGTFLGAGLGAFLIKFLTVSFIEPIVLIFILDSLLRMAVVFYWVPKIKEVKETKKLSRRKIKNLLFKQTKPILMEEVQQIMSIKEYMEKK
ncbi:MAG TPA: MFS transporter [Candidatus Nanoarchaeia archaeon]|nr:MFS transporter [Candidatus Nanoarchaeia archaeon]